MLHCSTIAHLIELQIPGIENAYCKWGLTLGEEWAILNGLGEGITQLARRGRGVLRKPGSICAIVVGPFNKGR